MERSRFKTTSFCLSAHRHLKSETYRALIQILSHCYDHSQISTPQEPRPDKEIREPGELVGPVSTVPNNSRTEKDTAVDESFGAVCIEDRGFGDARMTIDEIGDIMLVEENDNLSKQKLMDGNIDEVTGNHDKGLDRQQRLMDELEHIMKGDQIIIQENDVSFSAVSVDSNQSDLVALMNTQEGNVDVQQIVNEESRSEVQLEVDKGNCNLETPKSFDSSVNRSMNSQVPKLFENAEERNSLLRNNPLEVEKEIKEKETEVEKLVHTDGTIGAHNYRDEDEEVEEGEISEGFEVDRVSIDMISDDAAVSNEKKVSEDVINKRDFPCNEQNRDTGIFSESTSFSLNFVDCANSGRAVELKETVRDETLFKPKIVAGGTAMMAIDADRYNSTPEAGRKKRKASRDEEDIGSFSVSVDKSTVLGEIVGQSVTQKQGITSKEKPDSGVCNKKKRSAPSKEKKAKKKQKERKRRAEKNRQLGVRRLKLRPILQQKTVTYCRHYLKGRCQEGAKCKFSHDTVPLTKSTVWYHALNPHRLKRRKRTYERNPCCHFARKSCMKGDDCPFDHKLSKYPCNNFVAKGFCNRGDDCLFSHKPPFKEDGPSTSSACTPQLKSPSLLYTSNSLKQPNFVRVSHWNLDALSNHQEVSSSENIVQNVVKSVPKPPALAPKGISCLFLGKSSVVESGKLKQGSISPKRNDSGKVANPTEQKASDTIQNMDETPKRISVAPKGVNFLSYGNSPLENSSGEKLASSFMNSRNGTKLPPSNNFSVHEKAISSPYGENSAKVGNPATQIMSRSFQMSNDMLKKTQPVVMPLGLNFLSNGKDLTNNSFSNKQAASLPASSGNGINRSLQESQNTTDVHQNSSAIPWRLSPSPLAPGRSSDHSALVYHRSTSNSAQKALVSTLAFAAKIESEMKIKQSAFSNGVNCSTRGSGRNGGSLNDSAKASKILEFLSSVGHETKQ